VREHALRVSARQTGPLLIGAGAGPLVVTVSGSSMEPTVREGEKVMVVRGAQVRVGDVILFETGAGELELHRLIARLPGGVLVHRGDHPEARAGVVRAKKVIGRAELAWRVPGVREAAGAVIDAIGRSLRARWRPRPAGPR
jgi:signal peptidase I